MLKIFLDYYNLIIFASTLITVWFCNYITLLLVDRKYSAQQEEYQQLAENLKHNIQCKETNRDLEIEEYESAQNNNTRLDIEQLKTRSERITKNMNDLAKSKQEFYVNKKSECYDKLKSLIHKILQIEQE